MISLPRLAVNRPVTIIMVFCAIGIFGVLALMRLPVELMPNVSAGTITIFIGIRGSLPPPQIEQLITRKVEDALSGVSRLKHIISSSKMNRAVVTLEFEPDTNMDFAALEVRENFNKIKDDLPQDQIEKPVISRYEENDLPISILALTSTIHTPEFLRELVEGRLKERLMRVNGVANVEIGGGRERKILVELDKSRLDAYRIPIKKVINAISQANISLLGGGVETSRTVIAVKTMGVFKHLDELANLPIDSSSSGMIRLGHLAEIKDSFLEAESYARLSYQGSKSQEAVSVYVQKESSANTIFVSKRLEEALKKFTQELAQFYPQVSLHTVQMQARHIQQAIRTVLDALWQGAILAAIILYVFFKRMRYTFAVAVVIPLSVMTTFTLMYMMRISLNVISLSGLALGIGMLLDNSIVLLDNILRRRGRAGIVEDMKESAVIASEEMTLAIVASTASTVIVFLPMTFINKQIRMMYGDLSMTVTLSLVSSLVMALMAVPLIMGQKENPRARGYTTHHLLRSIWARVVNGVRRGWGILYPVIVRLVFVRARRLSLFAYQSRRLSFPRYYRRLMQLVLRYRYASAAVVSCAFIAACFVYVFVLDKEFTGAAEQNEFVIFVELQAGARLELSNQIVKDIENRLGEIPEVCPSLKTVQSRIEGWSSKIYITLIPKAERGKSTEEVIALLRERLKDIEKNYQQAEAFVYFSEPQASREFVIDVYGYDYDTIAEIAGQVAGKLEQYTRAHKNKGFLDTKLRYRPGRETYDFMIDKSKAALHLFSVKEIADTLHAEMRGMRASYYHSDGKELEIVPRLKLEYRSTITALDNLTLVNPRGDVIPLANLVFSPSQRDRIGRIPSEIFRRDKSRTVQVSSTLHGISLEKAASAARAVIGELQLPKNYYCEIGGEYEQMAQNQKEFTYAIIISLLLVYGILAALFESYLYPLIILCTVPLGFIGVVAAISITTRIVTIGVVIGLMMLGGIVVNNAIILIDRVNAAKQAQGKFSKTSLYKALFQTGVTRLRPIMMTTLTTILGLFPLAVNRSESASLWSPLAVTVIGGLSVSTILTLFIIPALYLISEELKNKLTHKGNYE